MKVPGTLPELYRAFRGLPEVSDVSIGGASGSIIVTLWWCGTRDPRDVVRDLASRSIAVGIRWRVEVYRWRWPWTRRWLRPSRMTIVKDDRVAEIATGIATGTMVVSGGREFVVVARTGSIESRRVQALIAPHGRALWRRVMIAAARSLLTLAIAGGGK